MIDWKIKLTSRKFWAAIASFVSMLVIAFGGTETASTQITALIMAGASVIAYTIGEGLIDSYWGDEPSGARRKYYRLTDQGRARLEQDRRAWRETREILDLLLTPQEADHHHAGGNQDA